MKGMLTTMLGTSLFLLTLNRYHNSAAQYLEEEFSRGGSRLPLGTVGVVSDDMSKNRSVIA